MWPSLMSLKTINGKSIPLRPLTTGCWPQRSASMEGQRGQLTGLRRSGRWALCAGGHWSGCRPGWSRCWCLNTRERVKKKRTSWEPKTSYGEIELRGHSAGSSSTQQHRPPAGIRRNSVSAPALPHVSPVTVVSVTEAAHQSRCH